MGRVNDAEQGVIDGAEQGRTNGAGLVNGAVQGRRDDATQGGIGDAVLQASATSWVKVSCKLQVASSMASEQGLTVNALQGKNCADHLRSQLQAQPLIQCTPQVDSITIPVGPRLGNVVVEAEQVSKAFDGRVLLDGASFTIPPGAVVVSSGGLR